jgi:hypothetical protein
MATIIQDAKDITTERALGCKQLGVDLPVA